MPDRATPSAATATPRRAIGRATLYLAGAIGCSIAFATYFIVVITLATATHRPEPVPRAINSVLPAAMVLGATMLFVAAGRHRRDEANTRWQAAVERRQIEQGQQIAAIAKMVTQMHERVCGDGPTVDLRRRIGTAYVPVAAVATGRVDLLAERVEQVAAAAAKAQALAQRHGEARRRRLRRSRPELGATPIDEKFQAYLAGREEERRRGGPPVA
jgi:hypothetical protein